MPVISLDHRWTFQVPAGSKVWLHIEGFRTNNLMQEWFALSYSVDGAPFQRVIRLRDNDDPDRDYTAAMPLDAQGTVTIQLTDQYPVEMFPQADTVSIDQLWIRVVP
jgi:hypothetical protein